MFELIRRFWADDSGALISTEWLCLSSLATLGVITGAGAVRDAVTSEFAEHARSIQAVNARYRAPLLQAANANPAVQPATPPAAVNVPSF